MHPLTRADPASHPAGESTAGRQLSSVKWSRAKGFTGTWGGRPISKSQKRYMDKKWGSSMCDETKVVKRWCAPFKFTRPTAVRVLAAVRSGR